MAGQLNELQSGLKNALNEALPDEVFDKMSPEQKDMINRSNKELNFKEQKPSETVEECLNILKRNAL